MGAQVGIYVTYPYGAHNHVDVSQGGQLNPETALFPNPKVDFGDGSDGNVVIAVNTALTRDMSYHNLTVNGGVQLQPMGFKIKVRGKLTITAGGSIGVFGGIGGNAAGAVGGIAGVINLYTATRLPHANIPGAGVAGGNGAGGAGAAVSLGGIAPVTLLDPVATQNLMQGNFWCGAGGGGGGAVSAAPTAGGTPLRVLYGAKGGDGKDGRQVGGVSAFGGGGGGAGGGLVEIWAAEIANNGTIWAIGGAGGTGAGDANAQGGGGGGGGGGAVIIYWKTASGGGAGTMIVTGGAGGASFGGLADGLVGANGYAIATRISV